MINEIYLQAAKEWAAMDPNETTRQCVLDMIQVSSSTNDSSASTLEKLFPCNDSRISFGTAGLRAEMKPGPLGMNDLIVIQTAQGLARYCESQTIGTVVIGYDHRSRLEYNLSSQSFAIYSTLCFQQAGMRVLLLDGFVATPMVPFAISQLSDEKAIGIMITASHNPKQDAGYKVYWSDGCQIRPPVDHGMADAILKNLVPWTDYPMLLQNLRDSTEHANHSCFGLSDPETTKKVITAYFAAVAKSGLVTNQASKLNPLPAVRFCYSAMHGVGHPFAKQVFETFHLLPFVSVSSQQDPDPQFPTVAFPNPEEKGTLALAQAFAEENNCQVILANDPDADRLAVAEYDTSKTNNDDGADAWTVFTGDQIGIMLGHWLWQQYRDNSSKPIAMTASTVSTGMLREIARVEGFHFEDTLTGFKSIGSRAAELNAGDYHTIFCYEEAIGYCCGDIIYDKDGLTAAGVFAELTMAAYAQGKTLVQHMQSLYDKYGEFVSNNGYFKVPDTSIVPTIMDDLTDKGAFTTLWTVGPYQVEAIRYLGEPGFDSRTVDKKPTMPTSKSSPMLSLYFENGLVAQFRGSGTEPKFKYYLELKGKPGVSRAQVTSDLREMSAIILKELFGKHGLC
jgi:phosphomannomutase